MNSPEQKAIEILSEIVDWWEKWNNSQDPCEVPNPPIDDAKQVLAKIYKNG